MKVSKEENNQILLALVQGLLKFLLKHYLKITVVAKCCSHWSTFQDILKLTALILYTLKIQSAILQGVHSPDP